MNKRQTFRPKLNGFTLIEVMVAFVVAAMILTVAFQAAVSSNFAQQKANEYELAVMHGNTLLARLGLDIPLTENSRGELAEGFEYAINLRDYNDPDAVFDSLIENRLILVEVQITRPLTDFEYSLLTLRANPLYGK